MNKTKLTLSMCSINGLKGDLANIETIFIIDLLEYKADVTRLDLHIIFEFQDITEWTRLKRDLNQP